MSYNVHNFQNGGVINAGPINEMDQQIFNNTVDIEAKLDSPAVAGTSGQVLSIDDNSNVVWAPPQVFDDTAGAGDTDKSWSADKLVTEFGNKANKSDTILDTTLSRGRASNTTVGTGSFAFGSSIIASGEYSHAEGIGDTGRGALGKADHAEGYQTRANSGSGSSAYGAHAEGHRASATADGAHAEGTSTTASAEGAHAEGGTTTASAQYSHAEGAATTASGKYSHAEGYVTNATATAAHAEGYSTTASGTYSHAEGMGTVANHAYQHAFGSYNIADPSTASVSNRGNYIEIVGKGSASSAKKNARTLDWNGNERLSGDVYVGCNDDSSGGYKLVSAADVATTTSCKAGTSGTAPVVPNVQHAAAFYGLAKAAGDSTQSASSNAVGTYTSEAKTAIKNMLGVAELPAVTASDNGKVLCVVNGAWAVVTIPAAEEEP